MIYLLALLLGLITVLLNVKSKILTSIVTIIICCVMVTLMAEVSPIHSFDTAAYQYMYNLSPLSHRFESGYMQLSYFFYTHGYSYEQFRLFSYAIFVFLLFWGVRRFTRNTLFFFTSFLIFPFFTEATQVRNFFMLALVVLGCSFFQKKSFWSFTVGILLIYCSSLFQVSGILYLVVPLLLLIPTEILIRISSPMIISFFSIVVIIHYFLSTSIIAKFFSVVGAVSGRSNTDDMATLYSQGSSFSKVLLYLIAFSTVYLLIRYVWKHNHDEVKEDVFKIIFAIFMVGIIAIPLLAGSADFERYLRNGITATLILFAIVNGQRERARGINITIIPVALVFIVVTTTAWNYWNPSSTGRLQYLPYIAQIKKP